MIISPLTMLAYILLLPFVIPIITWFILLALFLICSFLNLKLLKNLVDLDKCTDEIPISSFIIAKILNLHGRLMHGFEMVGIENIPRTGPAILICYHAAIPLDDLYAWSKLILMGRNICMAVLGRIFTAVSLFPGSYEQCKSMLESGHVVAIYPGGLREAIFSDHNYGLNWERSRGFARLAVETGVPIIPVFTQNKREVYRTLGAGLPLVRQLYDRWRIIVTPIYGGLPVKLRTIFGPPIEATDQISVDQIFQMTVHSMETLIKNNQRIPGSITQALLDRFRRF